MKMSRTTLLLLFFLFTAVVAIRLMSLPNAPFFSDVPENVAAIESGQMRIQFPGYVPFHLLAKALSPLAGGTFEALLLLSLGTGIGAWIYTMRLGLERHGKTGALLAFLGLGISPLSVYLSAIGASYSMDMLAVAALLFHGNRYLRDTNTHDFHAALAWFGFGILMRPLSLMFTGLGILYLVWHGLQIHGWSTQTKWQCASTILMGATTVALFLALSLPYYESLQHLILSTRQTAGELQGTTLLQFATNLFRFIAYPLWGFHLFLAFPLFGLIQNRKHLDRPFAIFCLLLAGPYTLLLMRYIPHAAYYALLLPVITVLPMLSNKQWEHPVAHRLRMTYACLLILFPLQWFLVKPIPTTNSLTLVANTYLLQYSRNGIKQDMFETLSSLSRKTGILTNRIPQPD